MLGARSAFLSAAGSTLPVRGPYLASWPFYGSRLASPQVRGEFENPEESGQADFRILPDTSGFARLLISLIGPQIPHSPIRRTFHPDPARFKLHDRSRLSIRW